MITIRISSIKKFLFFLLIIILSGSINFANAQPLGTFTFPQNPSVFPGPVTFKGLATFSGGLVGSLSGNLCTTTPEGNGAVGDGVTDDTTAMQASITVAQNVTTNGGGSICLGAKTYKISSVLTISKSISIWGSGVYSLYGSGTSTIALTLPVISPYITGSIIYQSGSNVDAIDITGPGSTVNLRNFGIYFGNSFLNTGHGIKVLSPNLSGHPDSGVFDSNWENVTVFGHDGNHYAFSITNPLYDTFTNLRSYGGGCILITNDTLNFNYGNSVFNHPYCAVIQSGTSNSITLVQVNNVLNMLVFIRPQSWVANAQAGGGFLSTIGPPTASQKTWSGWATQGQVFNIIEPDMETNVSAGNDLTSANATPKNSIITPGYRNALIVSGGGSDTNKQFLFGDSSSAFDDILALWGVLGANPSSPHVGATAGAGAGTSPPAPVIGASFDSRGIITFGTGTSPVAGAMVNVTFTKTYNTPAAVMLTPANTATQALGLYVGSSATTGFTVSATNAPAASQGNTIYSFHYFVME